MEHAWLDSLSEDWVSQPASEDSLSALPTSMPATGGGATAASTSKSPTSRLPRFAKENKQAPGLARGNSSNVLSERSFSEINIMATRNRAPSKLSQEIKASERGRHISRSVSVSTAGSVVHNTVNHKSLSASPAKDKGHTPEWKRRLVYGDLAYGEQRDLFTSAGAGLEDMFKPPSPGPQQSADELSDEDSYHRDESSMRSSPPPYHRADSTFDIHVDESVAQQPAAETRYPQKGVRYRMTEPEAAEPSVDAESTLQQDSARQGLTAGEQGHSSATSFSQLPLPKDEYRKVSGQSVIRNEDFSPVLISRQNGPDGRVKFAPMDLPPDQLRQRLEKLRLNQLVLGNTSINYEEVGGSDAKSFNIENTDDYEKLGGFINFRRGGRSEEGSFRHRVLSPAFTTDTSEMLPEESLQASTPKQFPTIRIEEQRGPETRFVSESPPIPAAPNPSPVKNVDGRQGGPSSPLKLFGPYDTFTNQTLLRRISQFEDQNSSRTSARVSQQNLDLEEVAPQSSPSFEQDSRPHPPAQEPSRSVSKFGAGELDGYQFEEGLSINSDQMSQDNDKENENPNDVSGLGTGPVLFNVPDQLPSRDGDHLAVQRRRQKSIMTSATSRRPTRIASWSSNGRHADMSPVQSDASDFLATPKQRDAVSETKRQRTSPAKDSTPKRRRTLHKSDIAYGVDDQAIDSVQLSHQHMQSIIGKKRKDARHGDAQEFANPSVLATRQILRPRTATPSQRSSLQQGEHSYTEDSVDREQSAEMAHPPLKAVPPTPSATDETGRKPSIKTEDFINEANKIMAMIRGKGGLQSGLTSVEESEAEHGGQANTDNAEDSFQESTKEPFSRPPSREGRPIPRISTRQEDPELADRLKRYEEQSDMGDIISSSVRSLGLAQAAIQAAKEVQHQIQDSIAERPRPLNLDDSAEISDPPNIRITSNPHRNGSHQGPDGTHNNRDGYPTNGSNSSSGNSTGRSIPTGSSRGSDTRRTIAPQSVSHLIPDQVGNMVLDRQQNIWIKRKGPGSHRSRRSNILPSEGSEDDPFADIPDLSVDVTKELQHLRMIAAQSNALPTNAAASAGFIPSPARSVTVASEQEQEQDPGHAATAEEVADNTEQVLSRGLRGSPVRSPSKLIRDFAETDEEEIEHEIRIHEDRAISTSPKRRNLTISFSSPIASIIQDAVARDSTGREEPGDVDKSATDVSQSSISRGRRKVSIKSTDRKASCRAQAKSCGPTGQRSVRGHVFVPRPVSRIDEQDEDTVLSVAKNKSRELSVLGDVSVADVNAAGERRKSLSFVVTTPARPEAHPRPENAQILSQYVGTLSLSPLSDFTAHYDQSYGLEVSYALGDQHLVTGDGSKRVMSLTVRDLVDRLAEVEPFEPYWEDMEALDVHDKRLSSLHMLDEFCGGLVKLDASKNVVRNLDGVPASIRQLKITHNHLSELTSWSHLMNLQYVDVSNNDIKSLGTFKNLVHLRSLTADNNNLTSLDGILHHDGLQTLRARGNMIEEIDFDGTKLQRLTDLDLEGNRIKMITNIDRLSALASLNLKGNLLEDFTLQSSEPITSLKYLTLSNNRLSGLDIELMPSLRLLHLDRNRLSKLTGTSRARRLDSLSLREQDGEEPLDISFLSSTYEIRKLFLSGNRLDSFSPPVDFLNLQLLDLANCGLQSLPEDLGQMTPNLRVVNLNYNALSDISCLSFIPRLKRLLLAGNRLGSAPAAVEVLQGFPYLAELDLRDNPITQGFYAPLQLLVRRDGGGSELPDAFRLPDVDGERDAAYCRRLDMETRMRRRLYERVLVDACRRLRKLDGLPLDRNIGDLRDSVWRALVSQGVLVKEDGSKVEVSEAEEEQEKEGDPEDESRWGAEDSFA